MSYLNTFLCLESVNYTLEEPSKMDFCAQNKAFCNNFSTWTFRFKISQILFLSKGPAGVRDSSCFSLKVLHKSWEKLHLPISLSFFFDKIIYENYINLNASYKNSSLGRQMYFKLNRCLFFPRNFSIGKFTSLGIKDTMRLHKLYSTCWLFQTQLSEIFFFTNYLKVSANLLLLLYDHTSCFLSRGQLKHCGKTDPIRSNALILI